MSSSHPAPSSFGSAGRRHLDDGRHLLAGDRHVTADHLAGLAAECLLKAVLVDHLGAILSEGKPPKTPDGTSYRHLPQLWDDIRLYAGGRVGSRFMGLLGATNPFGGWDIADRYGDGTGIQVADCRRRLAVAAAVATLHEQTELTGSVP